MIKIDTEGHDVVILDDLDPRLRPPVIWVEWFREYKYIIYNIENKIEVLHSYSSYILLYRQYVYNYHFHNVYRMMNSVLKNLLNYSIQSLNLVMRSLNQNFLLEKLLDVVISTIKLIYF